MIDKVTSCLKHLAIYFVIKYSVNFGIRTIQCTRHVHYIMWGRSDYYSNVNIFQLLAFVVKNTVRCIYKLIILESIASYKFIVIISDDYFLVHIQLYLMIMHSCYHSH